MSTIKIGDVVRLKDGSGPPAMTVEKDFNSNFVYVVWFNGDYLNRSIIGRKTLEFIRS